MLGARAAQLEDTAGSQEHARDRGVMPRTPPPPSPSSALHPSPSPLPPPSPKPSPLRIHTAPAPRQVTVGPELYILSPPSERSLVDRMSEEPLELWVATVRGNLREYLRHIMPRACTPHIAPRAPHLARHGVSPCRAASRYERRWRGRRCHTRPARPAGGL